MAFFRREDRKEIYGYITALHALAEGRRVARTKAQEQFVKVVNGERPPSTRQEVAYVRWMVDAKNHSAAAQKFLADNCPALKPSKPVARDEMIYVGEQARQKRLAETKISKEEMDRIVKRREVASEERRRDQLQGLLLELLFDKPKNGEFKKRFVDETWGSRDDWRKDSSRNRWNSK